MTSTPGIFCAIDTNTLADAKKLVSGFAGLPLHLKLGLEFFIAEGPQGVAAIRDMAGDDVKIFLDLKLHDIPNTVASAVRAVMKLRVDFLTIHTSGGRDMLRAAVLAAEDEQAKTGQPAPCLLGVTVLTHMDAKDLAALGVDASPSDQVVRLGQMAAEAGLGGAICAPQEIALLRQAITTPFQLVVPGIRPASHVQDDQKRIMTPMDAAKAGADYLVIGRPITQAKDPVQAAGDILASLQPKAA